MNSSYFHPLAFCCRQLTQCHSLRKESNHQSRNSTCSSTNGISRNPLNTHTYPSYSIINIINQPYPATSTRFAAIAPRFGVFLQVLKPNGRLLVLFSNYAQCRGLVKRSPMEDGARCLTQVVGSFFLDLGVGIPKN